MGQFGIGQPVRRKEDARLLTGNGRYTDDINLPGQLYAYFLRSPQAHAKILSMDTAEALAAPGVVAIYTGQDLLADEIGPLPTNIDLKNKRTGEEAFKPARHALAVDCVRCVGDLVAMVIAESQLEARDAAELIMVDYEELPPIANTAKLLDADAPLVWPERGSNLCLHWENGEPGPADDAFAKAAKVVTVDLVNNRVVPVPMEPRCALADFEADKNRTTLYAPTQGGRRIILIMARKIFKEPDQNFHLVAYDTGGGFGVRSKCYRAVKWHGDRSETFVSDYHGRDQVNHAEMAFDANGKILAMRAETILNIGAYVSENGPRLPINGGGKILGGAYDVPILYFSVKACFSNTTPTDTYRGAGRPEANYIMERLMERAAEAFGITPIEMRKRNFVSEFPYTTQMGCTIDSGDFAGTLDMALEKADWAGFDKRRAESQSRGKLRGIGIGYYVEGAGGRPTEEMRVQIAKDGSINVIAGTYSHGQGHHTVYSQLITDLLGVPFDKVNLIQGDSDVMPKGASGTFGSRSSMMGGVGIKRACEALVEKGKKIAGHLLQAEPSKVGFSEGVFRAAAGSISLEEIARAAQDPNKLPDGLSPGLDESYFYDRNADGEGDGDSNNFPNGCHICETEVDPDTGTIEIVAFTAVDDCGVVLNPMIVDGQVLGGIAQGIGQAIMENTVYDQETGQFLTGSFMDYGMPRAQHFPNIGIFFNTVPCTTNDLGVKGAGEAGCCGAPSALVHAVIDALRDYGIRHVDMPLTPERVWRTIQQANGRKAA
jgi:carbon-monoxide dehydrogenase large subunit